MTKGYIHSIESFGSVDGPGLRYIIFVAGCPLRCKFCHNPDTWDMMRGTLRSPEELIEESLSCQSYWGRRGGITVSGGEPPMQPDFLLHLLTRAEGGGPRPRGLRARGAGHPGGWGGAAQAAGLPCGFADRREGARHKHLHRHCGRPLYEEGAVVLQVPYAHGADGYRVAGHKAY